MIKFDGDFDYLLLLGIDPAKALGAAAALVEQIKAKKKEWTAQALNPLYQQAARTNLERAREFESLLAEPAALAAYVSHVKQCRVALRAEHEATVGRADRPGLRGPQGVDGRPARTAAEGDQEPRGCRHPCSTRCSRAGRSRSSPPARPTRWSRSSSRSRPRLSTGSSSAEIQNWLKVLAKGSLYELLDLPSTTPPPRLTSQAQLLFTHWSKVLPKTNTSTAWEKTLQASLTYLKDAESKAKYDRGLFNQRIQKLVSTDRPGSRRIDVRDRRGEQPGPDGGPGVRLHRGDRRAMPGGTDGRQQGQRRRKGRRRRPDSRADPLPALRGVERSQAGQVPAVRVVPASQVREPSLHRRARWPSTPRPARTAACRSSAESSTGPCSEWPTPTWRRATTRRRSPSARPRDRSCAGPAVEERLARVSRVRVLAAAARTQAAAQAWTAVRATLKELVKVAPRMTVPGVPTLEKVTQYVAEMIEKLRAIARRRPRARDAARVYLAILRRWSDCEEAFQKLRQLGTRLESERDPRRALQIVGKLLEIRPADPDLKAAALRLEPLAREVEVREAERKAAEREYFSAVRECRPVRGRAGASGDRGCGRPRPSPGRRRRPPPQARRGPARAQPSCGRRPAESTRERAPHRPLPRPSDPLPRLPRGPARTPEPADRIAGAARGPRDPPRREPQGALLAAGRVGQAAHLATSSSGRSPARPPGRSIPRSRRSTRGTPCISATTRSRTAA